MTKPMWLDYVHLAMCRCHDHDIENDVCNCYNIFIPFGADILLTKIYPEFVLAIEAAVIADNNLHYYRYSKNSFYFCKIFYNIIIEKKKPKFGSANCINVLL